MAMLHTHDPVEDMRPPATADAWHPGEAGLPVAFARTIGLYTPATGQARGRAAVLFLSPWGLEEMCTRKLWRILAERLSSAGFASLRFDYPGTGDALDGAEMPGGLAVWEAAAVEAAARLKALSGASRLVLVGHGLGAALAARLGRRLEADGLVLMAPVVAGKGHLRELAAWSRMIDEGLGLAEGQRIAGQTSVAGLVMPAEIAADLKKVNLEMLETAPAPDALLLERAGREKDASLSARLAALGVGVERAAYEGYDALVSNPTLARQPLEAIERVCGWIAGRFAGGEAGASTGGRPAHALLEGDAFVEEALRLGPGNRLSGTLCRPRSARRGATVILLGTAYDRHAGWARSTVETARHLAGHGVASLRFDAANVGDSPPLEGAPEQVQYSQAQIADAKAALDLVQALHLGPALLAGRCSGAYLAFRAALADERCAGVVAVNPFTFRWNPEDSVEDALRYNPRSLGDYRRRAFDPANLRRLVSGQIDLPRAFANIGLQIVRRLVVRAPAMFDRFSRFGRLRAAIHADFRALADRKVPVHLLYSADDVGLERYRLYFGAKGTAPYANVSFETIPDADHNLSPPHAQALYRERLTAAALAIPVR